MTAMTILLWIIGALVAFNLLYKFFNRKNFKVINYLKNKVGCNSAIAHRFVAFGMPDVIGFKGWAKMRDDLLKDPANFDLVILPLFVDWYLKQSPNQNIYEIDKGIIEESLSKSGVTLSDIERRLGMVKPMLAIYKLEN